MAPIITDLADADALLALSAEDLAPIALRTVVEGEKRGLPIHISALTYRIYESERHLFETRFPAQRRNQVEIALAEAWHLLAREGILVPEPGYNGQNGHMSLTKRGQELVANEQEFRGFKVGASIPKAMLHPAIADVVWKALARGDLENAVFEAFKTLEIAVRDAGGFAAEDLGTALMHKAFKPSTGILADPRLPAAEQQAQANLFAAAIGYYKNPQSHREVKIANQQRAQEIVLLASHLLHVVDSRRLG